VLEAGSLLLMAALNVPAEATPAVNAAMADVSRRFAVRARVVEVERVTWSDGSLGCPQPDGMYSQALVPGWRIVLAAGSRSFEYHAGEGGHVVHCPPGRAKPGLPGSRS
jgi:hypothetical protein